MDEKVLPWMNWGSNGFGKLPDSGDTQVPDLGNWQMPSWGDGNWQMPDMSGGMAGMFAGMMGGSTVPGYRSKYAGQIDDLYKQINNREDFQYDVNADAMYQALKDQYVAGGQMAMMDTMGQAQAMTGGYGNSYAQSVGQQAYQNYLTGLTDQIPDYYQMALQNYMRQGDEMMQQYAMLQDMENQEYSRYMDQMAMVQPQVMALLEQGITPSPQLLAASGLSPEYVKMMLDQNTAAANPGWAPARNPDSGNGSDDPTLYRNVFADARVALENGADYGEVKGLLMYSGLSNASQDKIMNGLLGIG
jgi:hypothetical protein